MEEELQSLLKDDVQDTSLTLPDVPTQPLSNKESGALNDAFFRSLPSVPNTNITDDELERELGRLALWVTFFSSLL